MVPISGAIIIIIDASHLYWDEAALFHAMHGMVLFMAILKMPIVRVFSKMF